MLARRGPRIIIIIYYEDRDGNGDGDVMRFDAMMIYDAMRCDEAMRSCYLSSVWSGIGMGIGMQWDAIRCDVMIRGDAARCDAMQCDMRR